MVVYSYNPTLWGWGQENCCEFEVTLIYTGSSRSAVATVDVDLLSGTIINLVKTSF